MDKSIIIIFSSSDCLYENISKNLPPDLYDVRLFGHQEEIDDFIDSPYKIDVLIIDNIPYRTDILSIYAKHVFTFVDSGFKHHILLKRPLILADFLSEIEASLSVKKVFAFIDGNIYCELRSSFAQKNGEIIKFSHIENTIFKHIILSKDFYLSKELLQKDVWKYSKNVETTTIEQSMNKLRNALPNGLLAPYLEGYKLFAKKIY